jgi:hypothetical protein
MPLVMNMFISGYMRFDGRLKKTYHKNNGMYFTLLQQNALKVYCITNKHSLITLNIHYLCTLSQYLLLKTEPRCGGRLNKTVS